MHVRRAGWMAVAVVLGWVPGWAAGALPAAGEAASALAAQEERIEPIDVNRATSEELQRVPGIGPATAQRIIEWREQHGPYERLEDLLNIRGIGEKTLEKLRPYLTVGEVDKETLGR